MVIGQKVTSANSLMIATGDKLDWSGIPRPDLLYIAPDKNTRNPCAKNLAFFLAAGLNYVISSGSAQCHERPSAALVMRYS